VITGLRLSGKEMAAHPVMMDMGQRGSTEYGSAQFNK
jgi:hypothetical protein